MTIDEQDDTVDEHLTELAKPGIASRHGLTFRYLATGKRFETQQQPRRIVGDVEYERAIVLERQGHACALEIVGERRFTAAGQQHEQGNRHALTKSGNCRRGFNHGLLGYDSMSRAALGAVLVVAVLSHLPAEARQQKPIEKIDPVAVVGCLKEDGGGWKLVDASDPVASTANAPTPKELATLDQGGNNEFQLIGTSIFNLPAHRNHWVVVKGLPISAKPVSRLNVTSVTMKADTCPPPSAAKIG